MNFNLQQITGRISFTQKESNFINILPENPSLWEGTITGTKSKAGRTIKNATSRRNAIKDKILSELLKIQTPHCIYCGISFEIKEGPDREHIAPKDKHPEYMWLEENLALSCALCNRFARKSDKETIKSKSATYSTSSFYLIHPYFDDFSEEYSLRFNFNRSRLIIEPADRTKKKAKWNIEVFELDSLPREKERMGAIAMDARELSVQEEQILNQIRRNTYCK